MDYSRLTSFSRRTSLESGFTLVELLAVMSLMAIMLSLAAGALKHYWIAHSFEASVDEVITQMRASQQSVQSESHPIVYGFHFGQGTADWQVLRYDPRSTSASCTKVKDMKLESGTVFQAATFTPPAAITSSCASFGAADDMAFFFARGSATPGNVVLRSDAAGRSRALNVVGVTGRVQESAP